MCDQVTCERTHHQGEVTPADIRTQLSRERARGSFRGISPKEIHLLFLMITTEA